MSNNETLIYNISPRNNYPLQNNYIYIDQDYRYILSNHIFNHNNRNDLFRGTLLEGCNLRLSEHAAPPKQIQICECPLFGALIWDASASLI